jgi:hypothetical protein
MDEKRELKFSTSCVSRRRRRQKFGAEFSYAVNPPAFTRENRFDTSLPSQSYFGTARNQHIEDMLLLNYSNIHKV